MDESATAIKLDGAPQDLPQSLTDGFDGTWYSLPDREEYLCVDDLIRLWRWRRNGGGVYRFSTLTPGEEVEYRTLLRQTFYLVVCDTANHIVVAEPGTNLEERARKHAAQGAEGPLSITEEDCPLCLEAAWDAQQACHADALLMMGVDEGQISLSQAFALPGVRVRTLISARFLAVNE